MSEDVEDSISSGRSTSAAAESDSAWRNPEAYAAAACYMPIADGLKERSDSHGLWMRKNRSDLALAKFSEANKYAPNWGLLHLKWGEASTYLGKHDEALTQFVAAEHLDLSAADKVELEDRVPKL